MIFYSAAAAEKATLASGTAAVLRTNAERRVARAAPKIGVLKMFPSGCADPRAFDSLKP
jgi:hypothetical protein